MESLSEKSSSNCRSKRNLTNEQRQAIFDALLLQFDYGKPRGGFISEVAALFSVHPKIVSRVWQQGKACIANGSVVDVSSKLLGRVGRKRVQIELSKISSLEFKRRTNIRSLSKALEVPKSTMHRQIKEGLMRPHTNALKPNLSKEGKRSRLRFCLSMLEPSSLESQPFFKDMYNYVHIDEKWFYLTRESERYYVLLEEEELHCTCKSKKFIIKVMFLAAVARPQFDANGNEVFSGKIGIFLFTCKVPAKRTSKNRVAESLFSIDDEATDEAVLAFTFDDSSESVIQQDNAKAHIHPLDPQFLEAAHEDGLNICLSFQPPNSPNMNVLDLGFFTSIQSLQHQHAPSTIDQLVSVVEKSFEELSSQTLNHVFLTLQTCMVEVMNVYGGNNYKLPHLGKGQLVRIGNLTSHIQCDCDVMENALAHLELEG
ncbi:uncharacterized protein LOC131332888 [Rhododendron vialii]|uniref:uncharacterized protein LOC131332888 n=1 Tax=Rhododendron vialii TaxID=182163 RepID=UPI00265D6B0D|nr:uncharacterized protein LOC131332888 [Rhododendron vialii]